MYKGKQKRKNVIFPLFLPSALILFSISTLYVIVFYYICIDVMFVSWANDGLLPLGPDGKISSIYLCMYMLVAEIMVSYPYICLSH